MVLRFLKLNKKAPALTEAFLIRLAEMASRTGDNIRYDNNVCVKLSYQSTQAV